MKESTAFIRVTKRLKLFPKQELLEAHDNLRLQL